MEVKCVDITLSHDDSSPCQFCQTSIPLTLSDCTECGAPMSRLNILEFLNKFLKGKIVDIRKGGLLIGRHTHEDDIPLYTEMARGVYHNISLVQGQEYVLSNKAYYKHAARIVEINKYKDLTYLPIEEIKITEYTRIFNTNSNDGILSVFADRHQFIVNRAATRTFFNELDEMNNSV